MMERQGDSEAEEVDKGKTKDSITQEERSGERKEGDKIT